MRRDLKQINGISNIHKDIDIPAGPLSVIETLNKNGYEAYAVGGCVRDSILGRQPYDWDITTNARPVDIERFFSKTIDTGIKHGTVTVVLNDANYEVTTYRIDGKYTDNRRPESVHFSSSLADDLSRRDFTINAIAYHPLCGFVDLHGGISDIEKHIIRAVGNADKRFEEDALRMLRALRFSAQLDFTVADETLLAIKNNSHLLQNISRERIREELTKLLISANPEKFALLEETGLLRYVLPELEPCFHTEQKNPYHIYNVGIHTLKAVLNIENSPVLRWTMLLHDVGKPLSKTTDERGIEHFYGHPEKSMGIAREVLKRLKFDNKTFDIVCRLIKHHDRQIEPSHRAVRKAIAAIGDDIFCDILKVKEADIKAQNPDFSLPRLEKLSRIKSIYEDIKENNQCVSTKDMAIDGSDLIHEGFKQGPEIGSLLNRLLDAVIENPELNTREKLLELARAARQ